MAELKTVSREQIEATKVFSSLEVMKQFFVKKKENIDWIKHNYTVASYQGWDKWLAEFGATTSELNKQIIKELLTSNI